MMTGDIAVMLALLALTIFLFIREWFPVDLSALLVLVLMGAADNIPAIDLLPDSALFSGFSSNAVIAIIGITIVSHSLDRTGLMHTVARFIGNRANSERGILAVISTAVGLVSSFMQNVGAAALFIPITSRIASRRHLPLSRLLMPMGFCAILGGTLTLVGSSPLIMLNDLLPEEYGGFQLFSVTPMGITILAAGITLFLVAGRWLLPTVTTIDSQFQTDIKQVYGIDDGVTQVLLAPDSRLKQMSVGEFEETFGSHIVALIGSELILSPHRDISLTDVTRLAVSGSKNALQQLITSKEMTEEEDARLTRALNPDFAGMAEIVVRPGSEVVGKTSRQLRIRKSYGIVPLAIYRGAELFRSGLRDVPFQAGDTLLCHTRWRDLARLEDGKDFGVITQNYPREEHKPEKSVTALTILAAAIALVIFTNIQLSLLLMGAALAMILAGITSIGQAYQAVSWKTVFLLACLIPLGTAMAYTGTADWLATKLVALMGEQPSELLTQLAVAIAATLLSLIMSNVGAAVLLVPLAAEVAASAGFDPGLFGLLVAVCVSNSFLLPTHQVNALIMTPGGYRVKDFLRAGGAMTATFIAAALFALNMFYH